MWLCHSEVSRRRDRARQFRPGRQTRRQSGAGTLRRTALVGCQGQKSRGPAVAGADLMASTYPRNQPRQSINSGRGLAHLRRSAAANLPDARRMRRIARGSAITSAEAPQRRVEALDVGTILDHRNEQTCPPAARKHIAALAPPPLPTDIILAIKYYHDLCASRLPQPSVYRTPSP